MSAYGAVWCPYIYFNRTDSKSKNNIIKDKNYKTPKKKLNNKYIL